MNKKYIVDLEGKVTIITDTGETIERVDKYTNNTDTILSLENLVESTKNKVHIFERRYNELNNKIRNKNKMIRITNIALTFSMFLLAFFSASVSTKLFLSVIAGSIPLAVVIGVIEKTIIKKDKDKRDYCSKRIEEGTHRVNKIRRKIDELSKDKTLAESPKTFTEIKPIHDYNIDVADYFIEKYLIEKRAKEMTHGGKKKVKKVSKQKNNIQYEI